MHSDFEELLSIFNAHEVKYLIVGGHAVMLYTEPRYTKDLDIWVDASRENAAKVFRALAPRLPASHQTISRMRTFYQIGAPPVRVDVLMSMSGLTFADAWLNRLESSLGAQKVSFIGRADLIRNKRAAGRHIDLHDVESLE
jgi:Nucleotidyl transferase of unknown function (DUF2204)